MRLGVRARDYRDWEDWALFREASPHQAPVKDPSNVGRGHHQAGRGKRARGSLPLNAQRPVILQFEIGVQGGEAQLLNVR